MNLDLVGGVNENAPLEGGGSTSRHLCLELCRLYLSLASGVRVEPSCSCLLLVSLLPRVFSCSSSQSESRGHVRVAPPLPRTLPLSELACSRQGRFSCETRESLLLVSLLSRVIFFHYSSTQFKTQWHGRVAPPLPPPCNTKPFQKSESGT